MNPYGNDPASPNQPPPPNQPNQPYGAPPVPNQPYGAPPPDQQYALPPNQQYGNQPTQQYPPPQSYGNQPNQQYGAPPPARPTSMGVQIPELLQGSIALATKPSNPPFGLVRGRGNLVMTLAYVAIGALVTGIVGWLLNIGLYNFGGSNLAWSPILTYTLGFTGGFAAFVFFLAQQMKWNTQQRDEFAAAASLYWVPVVLVLTVIGALLGGISFIGLLTTVTGAAQLLLLLGFSLLALKTLFNVSYEQGLRPVALGLLVNSLVIGLVARLIIEIL